MVLSRLNHLTHQKIASPAKPNKDAYTSVIRNGSITPAIISLDAKDTFNTGINAVIVFNSIPGKVPITAGKIITIFNGAMILCASLKDFA